MGDRYFPNEMPDFVEESEAAILGDSSLLKLVGQPYPTIAQKFLQAALVLKDKVVNKTWVRTGRRADDYTLYTGALGTAFLLFKSYQVTKAETDLALCWEIVGACETASRESRYVTFICGRAGVCALGAVAAKLSGDLGLLDHYLRSFNEIKMPDRVPNELLYGRAGYLWACSFLNKHIGEGTIPSNHTGAIAKEMIEDGRRLSGKGSCPLMYEWHGKKYWGAAHGLAGIMHVLMDMELKPEEQEYIKVKFEANISEKTMASKKLLLFAAVVFVASFAAPEAQAQLVGLVRISGIVRCSVDASLNTPTTPAFSNATVQLRCARIIVATTTTESTGAFTLQANLLNLSTSLAPLLVNCTMVVSTPVIACNVKLPGIGLLQSPLQLESDLLGSILGFTASSFTLNSSLN